MKYDCVVIGAGIAGMTAALYLKRAGVNSIIIEKATPGGVLNRTSVVENYPGVSKIDGVSLAIQIYEQIKQMNIKYHYGDVQEIKVENNQKYVVTSKETIFAKTIVIASGRIPRTLNLPNEEKLIGRGISWCAICDGFQYKGKKVAVVGSGNSAFEEALYLSKIASEVFLLYNSKKLKAESKLISKVKEQKNIILIPDLQIKQLKEKDNKLSAIILENEKQIDLSGVFIYIGYKPFIPYLDKLAINRKDNYLVVDNKMQTSISGIYACGDVICKEVYQLTTAVGEAAIAATSAKKQLDMM